MSDTMLPDGIEPEEPEGQAPEGAEGAGAAAPAAPAFDLKTLGEEISRGVSAALGSHLPAPASPAPPPEPTFASVDDAEFDAAVNEGKGLGTVVRKLISAEIGRAIHGVVRDEIAPLRDSGLGAIDNLTGRVLAADMPWYTKDAQVRTEVDEMLARMKAQNPALSIQPEARLNTYNMVIGRHYTRLSELEAAERARAAERPAGAAGAPSGGRGPVAPEGPDPTRYFGADFRDTLAAQGMELDAFARKLGYKDGTEYLALARAQEEGTA